MRWQWKDINKRSDNSYILDFHLCGIWVKLTTLDTFVNLSRMVNLGTITGKLSDWMDQVLIHMETQH